MSMTLSFNRVEALKQGFTITTYWHSYDESDPGEERELFNYTLDGEEISQDCEGTETVLIQYLRGGRRGFRLQSMLTDLGIQSECW